MTLCIHDSIKSEVALQNLDMSRPSQYDLNQYMGMSILLVIDTWQPQQADLHIAQATMPLILGPSMPPTLGPCITPCHVPSWIVPRYGHYHYLFFHLRYWIAITLQAKADSLFASLYFWRRVMLGHPSNNIPQQEILNIKRQDFRSYLGHAAHERESERIAGPFVKGLSQVNGLLLSCL